MIFTPNLLEAPRARLAALLVTASVTAVVLGFVSLYTLASRARS